MHTGSYGKRCLCLLGLFAWSITWAADPHEPPVDELKGALWKGHLQIQAEGRLLNQFLANSINDDGQIDGYRREKAVLNMTFTLEIQFLINDLGEYTLTSVSKLNGDMSRVEDFKRNVQGEIVLESGQIAPQTFQELRQTEVQAAFDQALEFDTESFKLGSFSLEPEGRMDRRGSIGVSGELKLVFIGSGKRTLTKSRHPVTPDYKNVREVADLEVRFEIPVTFSGQLNHRKKAVSGPLSVTIPVKNPFAHEDVEGGKRDIYQPQLNISGSIELQPLF